MFKWYSWDDSIMSNIQYSHDWNVTKDDSIIPFFCRCQTYNGVYIGACINWDNWFPHNSTRVQGQSAWVSWVTEPTVSLIKRLTSLTNPQCAMPHIHIQFTGIKHHKFSSATSKFWTVEELITSIWILYCFQHCVSSTLATSGTSVQPSVGKQQLAGFGSLTDLVPGGVDGMGAEVSKHVHGPGFIPSARIGGHDGRPKSSWLNVWEKLDDGKFDWGEWIVLRGRISFAQVSSWNHGRAFEGFWKNSQQAHGAAGVWQMGGNMWPPPSLWWSIALSRTSSSTWWWEQQQWWWRQHWSPRRDKKWKDEEIYEWWDVRNFRPWSMDWDDYGLAETRDDR